MAQDAYNAAAAYAPGTPVAVWVGAGVAAAPVRMRAYAVGGGMPTLEVEDCLPHVNFVRKGTTKHGWFQAPSGGLTLQRSRAVGLTFAIVARLGNSGTGIQEALLAGAGSALGSYLYLGRGFGSTKLSTSWMERVSSSSRQQSLTTYTTGRSALSGRWEVYIVRYYGSCANSPCARFFMRGTHLNATRPAKAVAMSLPRTLTNFYIGSSRETTPSHLAGGIREAGMGMGIPNSL